LTIIPTPVTVVIGVLANVANALWYASEGNYFEALCCTVGALGGAYSFLKITGLATKSCVLTSVIKNSTAVGSIAMGGIDIAMVGYDNYQKYVVRGEDFSWTDAALDTARIVLDSTAIAAGLQLYSEPVPTCFVAGTLVATADGHVAIEEIQVGDMVLAGDPETGEVAYKEVTRTFVNESDELIHVHTNGEEIITTPTHPFYVNQFGWTRAADLRAGDVLVLSNGEYVVVEFVQHEILESPVKVYNFEVEDFHTYFVGESAVLVHNICKLGKNMIKAGNYPPQNGKTYHAHHIFPQKFKKFFSSIGIDVNDANFGIWVESHEHLTNAYSYNKMWEIEIDKLRKLSGNAVDQEFFRFVRNLRRLW
jgi:hypothetical protein